MSLHKPNDIAEGNFNISTTRDVYKLVGHKRAEGPEERPCVCPSPRMKGQEPGARSDPLGSGLWVSGDQPPALHLSWTQTARPLATQPSLLSRVGRERKLTGKLNSPLSTFSSFPLGKQRQEHKWPRAGWEDRVLARPRISLSYGHWDWAFQNLSGNKGVT